MWQLLQLALFVIPVLIVFYINTTDSSIKRYFSFGPRGEMRRDDEKSPEGATSLSDPGYQEKKEKEEFVSLPGTDKPAKARKSPKPLPYDATVFTTESTDLSDLKDGFMLVGESDTKIKCKHRNEWMSEMINRRNREELLLACKAATKCNKSMCV